MKWLLSLDVASFRFLNQSLSHPWLDVLMPFVSGNAFFGPALVLGAFLLIWRGGIRGRLCVMMLLLVVGAANNLAVDALKHAWARPRPFLELADTRLLSGRGGSFSMPSSHAANWFAAAAVAGVYYRRSRWCLLPLAAVVGFSRIYNGVHYPADVLAGAATGLVIGLGGTWLLGGLWRLAGPRWFPLWSRQVPSLTEPVVHHDPLAWQPGRPAIRDPDAAREQQWLHSGYLLIFILLAARLAYLAADKLELSEDEAYQWLWSKHLALSYYSKPPLIAWTQFLGTRLWGDSEFGIRFFAPVISAGLGVMVLRFLAREASARAGFWTLLVVTATPLLAAGSVLLTIDSLSVFFWTAAMLAGWRAVRKEGRIRDWAGVGLFLGLGFLSKYTALLQWFSLLLFLGIHPPARRQFGRPGLYLALGINALCALPVFLWNAQHGWITLRHLEDRAGLAEAWHPTLRFFQDFTLAEAGLLNPVFFAGLLWAGVAVWRRRRHDPLLMYLLAMGAPLFLGYWLYTFRARVQPNWIAPAVLPLFCLMVVYADSRWRGGARFIRGALTAGLALGLPTVLLLHETNLISKLAGGRRLPAGLDPLRRVRGWRETARLVDEARRSLAAEGKPVFLIGDHYGITALLAFYVPAAKAGVPEHPEAYYLSSERPLNQFYFWPGYRDRRGENAIYVRPTQTLQPPPARLVEEFARVEDLGLREVLDRGRVLRQVQLFACHGLR